MPRPLRWMGRVLSLNRRNGKGICIFPNGVNSVSGADNGVLSKSITGSFERIEALDAPLKECHGVFCRRLRFQNVGETHVTKSQIFLKETAKGGFAHLSAPVMTVTALFFTVFTISLYIVLPIIIPPHRLIFRNFWSCIPNLRKCVQFKFQKLSPLF